LVTTIWYIWGGPSKGNSWWDFKEILREGRERKRRPFRNEGRGVKSGRKRGVKAGQTGEERKDRCNWKRRRGKKYNARK